MQALPSLNTPDFNSIPMGIDQPEGAYSRLREKVHRLSQKRRAENPVPAKSDDDLKKRKIEPAACSLHNLPVEVMEHIVSFLPSTEDILNFELASRTHQNYTQRFWKKKNTLENRNLIFPFDTTNDKQSYLLYRVVSTFILSLWSPRPSGNLKSLQQVYPPEKWTNSIPSDLHHLMLYSLFSESFKGMENPYKKTTENLRRDISEMTLSPQANASHFVLQALVERTCSRAITFLGLASENNPALALVTVKLKDKNLEQIPTATQIVSQVNKSRCFAIARLAMEKNEYRALNYCLDRWPDLAFAYPTIKYCSAFSLFTNGKRNMSSNEHLKAEQELLQALDLFEEQAPAEIYLELAKAKFELAKAKPNFEKWSEIEFFLEMAFERFRNEGRRIPSTALLLTTSVKYNLGKHEEADRLNTQVYKIYEASHFKEVPTLFFIYAAQTKIKLAKYKKAAILHEQAFRLCEMRRQEVPTILLEDSFYLKIKLGKTEKAEKILA